MNPARSPSDKGVSLVSWLILLTYLIHIAEEYWGGEGYSAYLLKTKGVYMTPSRFLIVQAIGVVLMAASILIAKRLNFRNGMAVILGATIFGNAATHIVSSLRTFKYEPGLLSSILIWVPLGLCTILYFRRQVLNAKRFWISIAIGIGINVVIAIITLRGGRL